MTRSRSRTLIGLLPLLLAACETSTPPPTQAVPPPAAAPEAKGAPAPTMTPTAQTAATPPPQYEARVDPLAVPKFNSLGIVECDDYLEAARQCLNSHQLDKKEYRELSNIVSKQMGAWHLGKHDAETCINARAETKAKFAKSCLNL